MDTRKLLTPPKTLLKNGRLLLTLNLTQVRKKRKEEKIQKERDKRTRTLCPFRVLNALLGMGLTHRVKQLNNNTKTSLWIQYSIYSIMYVQRHVQRYHLLTDLLQFIIHVFLPCCLTLICDIILNKNTTLDKSFVISK